MNIYDFKNYFMMYGSSEVPVPPEISIFDTREIEGRKLML